MRAEARAAARARRAAAARAWTLGILAGLVAALCVALLEGEARGSVTAERLNLAGSPATLWRPAGPGPAPLVIVAHGYGGSRQMMAPLAIALARGGHAALAFDFHGHGRHPVPMDAEVTSLEGTTAQLVGQTLAVARAARALPGVTPPAALLGHSMATDVVVRAAPALDVGTVVAISMYSEAVTPDSPARLLIVSGAAEGRLRAVALDAVRQVGPAREGETVRAGATERRAVAAPRTEHVGVLYSAATMREARAWIGAEDGALPRRGPLTALLLAAILALAWPLSRLAAAAPRQAPAPAPPSWRVAAAAILLPAPAAVAAAALAPAGALGLSAFGQLAAFLAAFGAVQSAVLWRAGRRLPAPGWAAGALYLAWALLFALALDRYGAAFVPTGPRVAVAALLALGTGPLLLGDALLTRGAPWPLRAASPRRAAPGPPRRDAGGAAHGHRLHRPAGRGPVLAGLRHRRRAIPHRRRRGDPPRPEPRPRLGDRGQHAVGGDGRLSAGGDGGIRTHGTPSRPTVFKTAAFDRSATSPCPAW